MPHSCVSETYESFSFLFFFKDRLQWSCSLWNCWWKRLKYQVECGIGVPSFLKSPVAPHSSTLAWKIQWSEEPGGLQSMGSQRVRHDWVTSLSLFTFMHWRRKWQPTPVFLPGESQGRGAWWAAVYGVTQSRTWLKWLSSSSSRNDHELAVRTCSWSFILVTLQ